MGPGLLGLIGLLGLLLGPLLGLLGLLGNVEVTIGHNQNKKHKQYEMGSEDQKP